MLPYIATPVIEGVFQLEIYISDTDIPIILDTTTDTWIEITDASNSTTFPRQKLNSVHMQ